MNNVFMSRGFQTTSNFIGAPIKQRSRMGDILGPTERAQLQSLIKAGTPRLAQIRSWLTTQYAKDPTLLATFKEQFIVDNWRGYDDIVTKDQASVDLASQKLASSDPANWDFSADTVERVNEWAQVVDIMYSGMQEYGSAGGGVRTMAPLKLTPSGGAIAPGALLVPPPSSGLQTSDLLIGGVVAIGLGALVYALL